MPIANGPGLRNETGSHPLHQKGTFCLQAPTASSNLISNMILKALSKLSGKGLENLATSCLNNPLYYIQWAPAGLNTALMNIKVMT